jgi:hypothetical protein
MLIPTLTIKPEHALKLDQAQMILDFETLMVKLGLKYALQCVQCYPRTDLSGDIVEAQITKDGKTFTLELACACSRWVYRGEDLIASKPPEGASIAARDILPDEKERVDLGRLEMFTFEAFDQLREHVLKMRYWMRCMRCESENQNDGIYGKQESTGSRFVVECSCRKRVYEGHDAPALTH